MKRILIPGGFIIEGGQYLFFLTDHLGSTHLLADKEAMVYQQVNYYPFGMAFADGVAQDVQPYKFTGKELDNKHKIGIYDSKARMQDTQIPRFLSIDPLAEKYYSWSPYVYCANNPLRYIDPDGRKIGIVDEDKNVYEYKNGKLYFGDKVFTPLKRSFLEAVFNAFETVRKADEKFDKIIGKLQASKNLHYVEEISKGSVWLHMKNFQWI